ncbi:ATP-grasp domain-containing protein [Alteromonas ponticola]|uniref:ATP-grasp fold RimK-type domain-containing protein n=1 Tax=Alteromonas ponticola TaxID=2720613 RepID=A0ABX1R1B5_9ALTE|nr:hypothetical protein [Alteromonas ponticola]NMH60254.1 hypothetical protein [Alteromonas ponticola]
MTVLILGSQADPQVLHVQQMLNVRGHQAVIFDGSDFPTTDRIHFDVSRNECTLLLATAQLPINEISSVYWHCFNPPQPQNVDASHATIARQNCVSALNVLLYAKHINWVNGIDAIRYHQSKPLQLLHASSLGATIPETIITNEKSEAEKFVCTYKHIIVKPVYGGTLADIIGIKKLQERIWPLMQTSGPLTFQRYIGGTNIRTYVCGVNCVTVELRSDNVDFRTDARTEAKAHPLADTQNQLAVSLCKQMGMRWCAIDWRLDNDGVYWFLEINPAPCFLRIECETGLRITHMLLSELLAEAKRKPPELGTRRQAITT